MSARGLPPALRDSLRVRGGSCYRHCQEAIRVREIAGGSPGLWQVMACPSGVVSVVSYSEFGPSDPSSRVLSALRRWTRPPSRVRRRDLRLATRHGPELGPRAERWLAHARPGEKVWVVYWRVYPVKGPDGVERRLGVCFRHPRSPVFFLGAPDSPTWGCPDCPPASRPSPSPAKRDARPRPRGR